MHCARNCYRQREAANQAAGSHGTPQLTLRQRRAAQCAAFTLLDCVAAITIMGIVTAISIPRAAAFLDSLAVHGAVSDAFAIFSTARAAAVSSAAQATVDIDTVRSLMVVKSGTDTILARDLGLNHKVKLAASRQTITYSASGLGYGAGNLTLVIKRGRAVDSLFVSRLGRVRH
jgi:type II secretory pathway pseudopilin PulG